MKYRSSAFNSAGRRSSSIDRSDCLVAVQEANCGSEGDEHHYDPCDLRICVCARICSHCPLFGQSLSLVLEFAGRGTVTGDGEVSGGSFYWWAGSRETSHRRGNSVAGTLEFSKCPFCTNRCRTQQDHHECRDTRLDKQATLCGVPQLGEAGPGSRRKLLRYLEQEFQS